MSEEFIDEHIIVKQSAFFLVSRLIILELLFFFSYLASSFVLDYFELADKLRLLTTFSIDLIIFICLLLIQIGFTIYITLAWARSEYEIIPGRIIARGGILSANEEIYNLEHVNSVKIHQSFFGKLFKFGTIEMNNPVQQNNIFLYLIPDPFKYKSYITKMRSSKITTPLIIQKDN